jgi:phosphoribosyl-ATP pyrophosphohydrolase/phosphoribosyl-AMP cyclohydrolase
MNREQDALQIDEMTYNDQGLIAAIVQDATDHVVLMMAWMNRNALAKTVETGEAWFYSRSRDCLWHKGGESGNVLKVHEIRYDCDADAVLLKSTVMGDCVACHTGARSCFYRTLPLDGDA